MLIPPRALLLDVLWYIAGKAIPGVVGLGMVLVFVRLLGHADFGKYALLISACHVIEAMAYGWINQSILRFNGGRKSSGPDGSGACAAFVHKAWLVVSGFLIVPAVTILFIVCGSMADAAMGVVYILCYSFYNISNTIKQSELRPRAVALAETLRCAIFAAGGMLFFILMPAAQARHLGIVAASIASCVVMISITGRNRIPGDWDNPLGASTGLGEAWRFGWPVGLWIAGQLLIQSLDRLIIEGALGLSALGKYAALHEVMNRAFSLLLFPITLALHPRIMRANATEGRAAALRLVRLGVMVLSGLSVVYFVVVSLGKRIIAPIVAPGLDGDFVRVIPHLAVGSMLWQLALIAHKPMEMDGRTKTMLGALAIAIAAHVSIGLSTVGSFGIRGIAWGWIAGPSIYLFIVGSMGLVARPEVSCPNG